MGRNDEYNMSPLEHLWALCEDVFLSDVEAATNVFWGVANKVDVPYLVAFCCFAIVY